MAVQRLALIGANGMLARKLRELAPTGYVVSDYDLPGFDLTGREQVLTEMTRLQPAVIINCAAFTDVDGCETQEELATRVNGDGPGYLAGAAKAVGAVLVHISTDYVFDGRKKNPYLETDQVGPLSAYGRSKLAGERAILASGLERYFIIRTSWLYGPGGRNFVETIIRLAHERDELRVVADQVGSPTYTGDLAEAIFNLLGLADHSLYGIYHYANEGQCSWYEFAVEIVELLKGRGEPLRVKSVVPVRTDEYPLPAPRPANSIFSKSKYRTATGAFVPEWQSSLKRYLQERSP
jgi:dTDP-4-dehydrorhamnose reductase